MTSPEYEMCPRVALGPGLLAACAAIIVTFVSPAAWAMLGDAFIPAPFIETKAGAVPVSSDAVELVSVDVVAEMVDGRWHVETTHVLRNTRDETVSLTVGCPDALVPEETNFETRVREEVAATRLASIAWVPPDLSDVDPDHVYGLVSGKVRLFDVRFDPGETVEVRHTYRDSVGVSSWTSRGEYANTTSCGGETAGGCQYSAHFAVATAGLWAGSVGRARFTARFDEPGEPAWTSGYRLTSRQRTFDAVAVTLERTDWEPRHVDHLTIFVRPDAQMSQEVTGGECPRWIWRDPDRRSDFSPDEWEEVERERWRELLKIEPLERFRTVFLQRCRNAVSARYGYPFGDPVVRERLYRPPADRLPERAEAWDPRRVEIDVEVTNHGAERLEGHAVVRVEPIENADPVPVEETDFAVSRWKGKLARVVTSITSSGDPQDVDAEVSIPPGESSVVTVEWELPDGWWWAGGYFNFDLTSAEGDGTDLPPISTEVVDVRNAKVSVPVSHAFYQVDPRFPPAILPPRDWAYVKALWAELERRRRAEQD